MTTRVARFSKQEKIYQMNTKCTKWSQIIPMSVRYSKWPQNILTFSNLRPSKIYPNWDFWFGNKPSGNPGDHYLKK
jgi:hypothetical protein